METSRISLVSKKSIAIIVQSRFYLSSKTLLSLYYSLVYPYLTYCNVAWSSIYCSESKLYLPFAEAYSAAESIVTTNYAESKSCMAVLQIPLPYFVNLGSLIFSVLILSPSPFSCIRITTIFCQLLQYNNRTAFQYISHFCRTNIKKFMGPTESGILYQSQ